jgi:DNA-directed RNA polymerase alpha subunit
MSDHNKTNDPDLVLSVRGASIAKRVGANTVGDLVRFTADEILSAKCFGETSLQEIRQKLAERGLRLGMTPKELQGRAGLRGQIVAEAKTNTTQPVAEHEHEHEGECCGHCEAAARKLRERAKARALEQTEPEIEREQQRKLNMSLAELELSVRTTNVLEAEGITTVRELVKRTAEGLLKLPKFGAANLRDVTTKLAKLALYLEMHAPERV